MKARQIPNEELEMIRIEEGTPGGKTYYFYDPVNDKEITRCNRTNSSGMACPQPAGWWTDHVGTGACKKHGGLAGRASIKGGIKTSPISRGRLRDKINVLLGDVDELIDLSKEMAAAKVLAAEMIDAMPEIDDDEFKSSLIQFMVVLKTLAGVADKISLMKSRQAMTAAQVLYVRSVMVDVFVKHLRDPLEREAAVKDLVFRLGGTAENFIAGQTVFRKEAQGQ